MINFLFGGHGLVSKIQRSKRYGLAFAAVLLFGTDGHSLFAQTSASVLYVPLIGISSVPEPLALPQGPGNVTYHYAVKNFLKEAALTDVRVVDDKCSPVKFVEGDDNDDGKLDYSETWRYSCTTKLSETTQSIATAIGTANGLPAAHKAYATVVVGSDNSPPLINIINITKVAYPLTLPSGGGDITFTYRVNNPGVVPLGDVSVVDDKCGGMSSKLGDTNDNNLLDISEVWVYTCTTHLNQTTTNTVSVMATANGLRAVGYASLTVTVKGATAVATVRLPKAGTNPIADSVSSFLETATSGGLKKTVWVVLLAILVLLLAFFVLTAKKKTEILKKKLRPRPKLLICVIFIAGITGLGIYFFLFPRPSPSIALGTTPDKAFGWKFPVAKFPLTGSSPGLLAYSDIRDPGGIPQGLPVRLKVPAIGVDSAVEDALITPDGRMDVPAGSKNVAWFALGPHPGEKGSAVIGGHFGITNGVPFVFYKLDKLAVGDKIYIVDDKDDTLAFVVRSIRLFDRNADATTVFTSDDGLAHLNLITCEGVWNKVNDSYPKRRVVFADAVPTEGALAPATASFHRLLFVGTTGSDVAILQSLLEKKGFLIMPTGIAKGFFGGATRVALAKYQESVGLPPVGTFGPLTRARIISELGDNSDLPNTGVEETVALSAVKGPPAPPPTFIQSMKSLYATPLDTLITVLLLASIFFGGLKVIKHKI